MRVKKRYHYVNSAEFKSFKTKNLFDNKDDPRIKLFEKLEGWQWSNRKSFPEFKEALKITKKMNVDSVKSYLEAIRKSNPYNLPFKPNRHYREDWISFNHYLGIDRESNIDKSKNKLSYLEAKTFLKRECKGLVNSMGLFNKWKKGQLNFNIPPFPKNMPKNPRNSYKKEWVSSFDFFGKDPKEIKARDYPQYKYEKISFEDLKTICQKQGIKTRSECNSWLKKNKESFYKMGKYAPIKGGEAYKEFKGWDDFLGKTTN